MKGRDRCNFAPKQTIFKIERKCKKQDFNEPTLTKVVDVLISEMPCLHMKRVFKFMILNAQEFFLLTFSRWKLSMIGTFHVDFCIFSCKLYVYSVQGYFVFTYCPFKIADSFYLVALYNRLLYPKKLTMFLRNKKITWSFPSLKHGPHFSLRHHLPSCKHLQGPGIKNVKM